MVLDGDMTHRNYRGSEFLPATDPEATYYLDAPISVPCVTFVSPCPREDEGSECDGAEFLVRAPAVDASLPG